MVLQDMGHLIAEIPLTEGLETLYASPVIIPQSDTEQILLAHLQKQGVEIERNVECVDLRQDVDGVTCDLRRPDGTTETITVGWLAGCDGARSIARHKLPVDFTGLTEDSGFILADAKNNQFFLLWKAFHNPNYDKLRIRQSLTRVKRDFCRWALAVANGARLSVFA